MSISKQLALGTGIRKYATFYASRYGRLRSIITYAKQLWTKRLVHFIHIFSNPDLRNHCTDVKRLYICVLFACSLPIVGNLSLKVLRIHPIFYYCQFPKVVVACLLRHKLTLSFCIDEKFHELLPSLLFSSSTFSPVHKVDTVR